MNLSDMYVLPFATIRLEPVGSRVTCNPPPENTDRDWLVLVAPEVMPPMFSFLERDGWKWGGSHPHGRGGSPFASFTRGIENLIITDDPEFFKRFMAATSIAKLFNVMEKWQRIQLFQAVLYGVEYDEKEPFQ